MYCSPSDLVAFGAPRGSTPNPGRPLASLTSSVAILDGHEFETGDAILFAVVADGALPSPLVAGTTYYAQRESEHAFKVRATAGGSALTIGDATDTVLVTAPLDRDAAIAWADRIIDDMVPGQATPFDDSTLYPAGVPAIVRMTSAELAAGKLAAMSGAVSKSLAETVDAAGKRLARWAGGLPVRGTPDASRANVPAAVPATALGTAPCSDRRGWRRWGSL